MIEKTRRKRFNTLKKNSYEYYYKKSYKKSKYSYTKIKILELDDSNYFTNKHQKKSFDYSNSENKENIIDYYNQTETLPSTENKNYKIKNIKKNYNKNNINNNKNNNNCNNNFNNLNSEKNKKNIIINIEKKNINYKNELNDNINNNNLSQSEYSDEFSEEFENDIENIDDNDNKINDNNNNLLNISTQEIKDAYYYPKKLQYVKNMFFTQKMMQFKLINNFINNNNNNNPINRVNSMNEKILYKNNSFFNSDSLENKLSINNNNSNFILSPIQNNNNKNNINLFNLYESNIIPSNSNSTTLIPSLNLNKTINNVFIGNSYYDTNTINNCITNNSMDFYHKKEKEKENTDILCINIKINSNELLVFKIRRYDDMFKTVKIFCEINKLDTKYIKPLIIYIIRALNSIYGIYNLSLNENEIKFIEDLREKDSIKNYLNNKNTSSSSYENDNNQNIIDNKNNESEKICKN